MPLAPGAHHINYIRVDLYQGSQVSLATHNHAPAYYESRHPGLLAPAFTVYNVFPQNSLTQRESAGQRGFLAVVSLGMAPRKSRTSRTRVYPGCP